MLVASYLALLATIFFNYGPLLMKVGLDQLEEIKGSNLGASLIRMFTNKHYLAGLIVSFIGGLIYAVALYIAGVTIVQPLLNFGFIVLVIMARRMLGEKLDLKAKFAIAILIIMPLFITLSQVSPPLAMQSESNMIWFTVICTIGIIILYLLSRKILILWAFMAGIAFGMSAVYTQWFILIFGGYLNSWSNLFIGLWLGIIPLILLIIVNIVGNFVFNAIGLQKNPASRMNPIDHISRLIIFNLMPDRNMLPAILLITPINGSW